MERIMRSLYAVLLAGALAVPAFADEVLKSPCEVPTIPGVRASELVTKNFNKHGVEYKKCTLKFVEEQQKISRESTDYAKSNAAFQAAEAATKEYNEFTEQVNERNAKVDGVN
jgi:acid phosphatase class B